MEPKTSGNSFEALQALDSNEERNWEKIHRHISHFSQKVCFNLNSSELLTSHLVFLTWMLLLSFSRTNSPVSWLMMRTQSFWYGRLFPLNTVMGGVEPLKETNSLNTFVHFTAQTVTLDGVKVMINKLLKRLFNCLLQLVNYDNLTVRSVIGKNSYFSRLSSIIIILLFYKTH